MALIRSGHVRFLPNPFQFTIHHSSCHSQQQILRIQYKPQITTVFPQYRPKEPAVQSCKVTRHWSYSTTVEYLTARLARNLATRHTH